MIRRTDAQKENIRRMFRDFAGSQEPDAQPANF
jgi:hypothetical protein